MTRPDVVIVGGGVIGLSTAYELAREGATSTVLDQGPLGRAASWAGAGIIAPPATQGLDDPETALRTLSARRHAEWAEALRDETGIDNGYRRSGGLDVAMDEAEEAALDAHSGLWSREGVAFDRLSADDLATCEPALGPAVRMAYALPDRAQIRNPRHLQALIAACAARGVRLRPHTAARGLETHGERLMAVQTATERFECGAVVIAAGAWSEGLLAGVGLAVPTRPVKGQIVLLRADRPPSRRIIEHGSRYLVPRDDGRVLVGATEEDAGFDTRPTSAAVHGLLGEALRLCPALAHAEVERSWAGLRPGNLDDRPTIGRAPGPSNLIIATGHRRVGLQLSPGTAALVADLLLDRPPRLDLTPFRPGREPAPPRPNAFRS